MPKTALITGVAGQDGHYLSELLISKGYDVIGLVKHRTPLLSVLSQVHIEVGDITDASNVYDIIERHKPDELYNLAAQSHVGTSFKIPQETCAVNYTGYLNVLLAARKIVPKCKIYQAGTSEMYGYAAKGACNENTPFQPMSPYAISKVAAHWAGVNARYEANQFVCNGILFNHESPYRHPDFVTRKIIQAIAKGEILEIGNLDSVRDWGHAKDYVYGMWLMMQHDKPDDYVLATGECYSVRDFVRMAYQAMGKEIMFEGSGLNEVGMVDGNVVVKVNKAYYRPNDLEHLKGDWSKAKAILGWRPSTGIKQLVEEMIEHDRH